jgi:ribonuclease D
MRLIDTPEALSEVCRTVERFSWAGVDTEADSLHHYAEKLSLLQVTVGEDDFVIDPLVPLDLKELLGILSQKTLILQGADSDIRLLKKTYDFKPSDVFDTMIAAQILGYDKMGYVDLVDRHCGLRLSKAEQKADWSRRPLTEKMLAYAANDTHYLKAVYDAMKKELEDAGRLGWHRQQCQKLLQTLELLKVQESDRSLDWQIKGSRDLKGKALTFLRELWLWREAVARQKDRPSFKVLNSEYLIQVAQWAAANPGQDIAQWKEAPRNVKGEHRDVINRVIRDSEDLPQVQFTQAERTKVKRRWTDQETKLLTELKALREKKALELKIHPSLIATNATLEALAVAKPRSREALEAAGVLLPWQIETIEDELLKVLSPGV